LTVWPHQLDADDPTVSIEVEDDHLVAGGSAWQMVAVARLRLDEPQIAHALPDVDSLAGHGNALSALGSQEF
jgi:hypothetical protein